jgi:hypothetical protein
MLCNYKHDQLIPKVAARYPFNLLSAPPFVSDLTVLLSAKFVVEK